MSETEQLHNCLKSLIRQKGYKYKDIANELALSEASVKRLFKQQGLSIFRTEKICRLIGIDFSDLLLAIQNNSNYISELSPSQESLLVSDHR